MRRARELGFKIASQTWNVGGGAQRARIHLSEMRSGVERIEV